MEKLTIQQVCLKSDKLKKEIIKRLKCQIRDFEVVQHESEISIHWYAYYPDNPHIEIPYGWMISTGQRNGYTCMLLTEISYE